MANGKFSNPRPYREEEREIEEAFQKINGKDGAPRQEVYTPTMGASGDTTRMPELELPRRTPETGMPERPAPVPETPADIPGEIPEDVLLEEYPQEEPAEDTPGFLDRLILFAEQNRKMMLVGACAAALVLILGCLGIFFLGTATDPYNGKILNNVIVAGVNVGGMAKSEAVKAVEEAVGDTYSTTPMTVRLGGTTLLLESADTGAKLYVKAAVNAAYDYGRTGTKEEKEAAYAASFTGNHTIGLLPYLNLKESAIRGVLEDYAKSVGSVLTQTACALEGTVPDLTANAFDPETTPKLTLVITKGTPGVDFQEEELLTEILDAYSLGSFQVSWEATSSNTEPDPVDWEQVRQELCLEPVNATIDMRTYEVIPGTYGYTFEVSKAQQLVDQAQYGQILRLELSYVAPELKGEDVLYRDVLAVCKTPYSNNANRVTNLELACKAIDGVVLNPGQTFSFNDTLGERTAAKGYKPAPAYSGNELVDSLGGGICQVSSTLYCATLMADLETVQRSNHGYAVSYIDYGMDATVSWGGPDLKFRNSSNYPIQLKAQAADGYVTVEILGTEEKDYYIEMSYTVAETYEPETEYVEYSADSGYTDGEVIRSGSRGYLIKTYKNKYSRESGKLLNKEFVTNSTYKKVNAIVAQVAAPATEPTVPETTPAETTPPTVAPTDPPAEPTAPETAPPAQEPPAQETPTQQTEPQTQE